MATFFINRYSFTPIPFSFRSSSNRYIYVEPNIYRHHSEKYISYKSYCVKIPNIVINNTYNILTLTIDNKEYKLPESFKVIEGDKVDHVINVIYEKFMNKIGYFGVIDIDIENDNINATDLIKVKVYYKMNGFYSIVKNGKKFIGCKLYLVANIKEYMIIRPRLVDLKSHTLHEFDIMNDYIKDLVDNNDIEIYINQRKSKIYNYFDLDYIRIYDVMSNIPIPIEVYVNYEKIYKYRSNIGIVLTYVLFPEHTHYVAMLGFVYNPDFSIEYFEREKLDNERGIIHLNNIDEKELQKIYERYKFR